MMRSYHNAIITERLHPCFLDTLTPIMAKRKGQGPGILEEAKELINLLMVEKTTSFSMLLQRKSEHVPKINNCSMIQSLRGTMSGLTSGPVI